MLIFDPTLICGLLPTGRSLFLIFWGGKTKGFFPFTSGAAECRGGLESEEREERESPGSRDKSFVSKEKA